MNRRGLGRDGFTLVELLVVVVILALLAMLGLLKYTDLRYAAKAAAVSGDIRTITVAAFNYQADTQDWPPEAAAGVVPTGLDTYLPGFAWSNPDYTLDWDNFGVGGGAYIAGVTVTTTNPALMAKLIRNLGSKYPYFASGSSLTYIIQEAAIPGP